MIDLRLQKYAVFALMAAALFGASTPLAKLLLNGLPPLTLAGLLYLGSGLGLLVVMIGQRFIRGDEEHKEASLTRADYPWLAGAVVAGGVIAPVMLMWGLSGSQASATALLLNFEGVITTLVAAAVFREAITGRIWAASLVMLFGGLVLSYQPAAPLGLSSHSLAVIGACLMWAIDNNLTRKVSQTDPVTIATIKGLVAGVVNTSIGLFLNHALPTIPTVAGALLLGLCSYGVSLVLFIYALRHLGSARAGAHFSTAPFIGALIAVVAMGEPMTMAFVVALALMAIATWLALTEQHAHEHTHEHMLHEHLHEHDDHHQHQHIGIEGSAPHSHPHVHDELTHRHPHLPDIHHRHQH